MSLYFSEDQLEQFLLKRFGQDLNYHYVHGPELLQGGDLAERSSTEAVLLRRRLSSALARLNPDLPKAALQEVQQTLEQGYGGSLIDHNEQLHRYYTDGVKVSYSDAEGSTCWGIARLFDVEQPYHNDFLVANQVTVKEDHHQKRLDIVVYVNGIPLVVIELKHPTQAKADMPSAFRQIQTYQALLPTFFAYTAFSVISDGLYAQAGTLSADFDRYMQWRSPREAAQRGLMPPVEILVREMLHPEVLIDLLRYFIVFDKGIQKDPETGETSYRSIKKLAGYHQYYAVNKAVDSTLRAAGYDHPVADSQQVAEEPEQYGLKTVQDQARGDRRGGVMWHTQGSGKSLSMVFYAGKLIQVLQNPTLVVLTDRRDLDDQLFETFANCKALLHQDPIQAESRQQLRELLATSGGGVVFTTIQKFYPEADQDQLQALTQRDNVVVIVDEAHRTQYGFKAKELNVKDDQGVVVGTKTVYGFAHHLRQALPNATYIGFTGTPIEKSDANTPAVFGHYIDVYDIARAVEDGATVPIYYESRLAKVELPDEGKALIDSFDEDLEAENEQVAEDLRRRHSRLEALIGSQPRINTIARDVVQHFEARQEVMYGKGMVVCLSRKIAARLYEAIVQLRPEWHDDALEKGALKVVMTAASTDGPLIAKHHTTKQQRRMLAARMRDVQDPLRLVIVCDMWLTGFDAPCLHTIYLDKPMKGHTLMQAITRVNRVYKDKPGGLVVDYLGVAADLRKALSFYSDAGGRGDHTLVQAQAVGLFERKLEVVRDLFYGFNYAPFFSAEMGERLAMLLGAQEHILSLTDGRKRYLHEVSQLSRAMALATPNESVLARLEEVAFFEAVAQRLKAYDRPMGEGQRSSYELEMAVRQVIDQSLVTDEVIDIYAAAGLQKPDISILSEEFMAELKGMPHKNLAMEVLRRLLEDKIREVARLNMLQSSSFRERLEKVVRQYHNKVLTAAEVIEELIHLGRDIRNMDDARKALNLEPFEYAFYTAIADNESARELMQHEKLRELAVVLTERVRTNASIDWTLKESARAKLRVIVKRTLRQYGYPPDLQKLATDTVLKQAKLLAEALLFGEE